ncbi:MAG: chemotaxis protein CheD [Burkholderiaceae bacterium]|nr:chemotaxis protein CheD [Burkholderiaceae bacterium]
MLVLENRHIGKVQATRGQSVYLLPGQLYFGNRAAQVKTLLGSCVALTLWHPHKRYGGMCHYLLPERHRPADGSRDGRFGDEALEQLVDAIERSGTRPADYEAQVYGGADTMKGEGKLRFNVGERNVEKAWALVEQYGFSLTSIDVGGEEPRTITLEMVSGVVQLKRGGTHLPAGGQAGGMR